ncbi:hypothetical protein [Bartonella sp. TP]|uniref:hypothetical protein n=1 Tax=Bartonella sp. TP TaxID=3057550 RepID=UPI0025B1A4BD|nr:hypothetical protein [Bartonella sp. TP]WJW80017.1 hypothetical protein QVL57_00160 [Bartonella sp. TP]
MSIFDFVSPIFNALGVHMQNQTNAQQANLNRQFQERMSNTAHQREVADLRAAGLNPILSANSGASSPSGSVSAPAQNMFGNINSAYSLHLQEQSMKQQLDLQKAQIRNINAQAQNTNVNTARAVASYDHDYDFSLGPFRIGVHGKYSGYRPSSQPNSAKSVYRPSSQPNSAKSVYYHSMNSQLNDIISNR